MGPSCPPSPPAGRMLKPGLELGLKQEDTGRQKPLELLSDCRV